MPTRAWDDKLLSAYLEHGRLVTGKSPGTDELAWAYDAVCEITDSQNAEEILPFVLALVARTPDELLNYVAAGPVEDVLRDHGPAVIDRILRLAERDRKLRSALKGVWARDSMDATVARSLDDALRRWFG
jgi:hypothetical protein